MAEKYLDHPTHVDLFGRGYDVFGQDVQPLKGFEVNKEMQTVNESGVPAKFITSGESYATVIITGGAYQSDGFVSGASGYRWLPNGTLEANDGYFRGSITGANGIFTGELRAATGEIGGFIITAQKLYGGIIQTSETVGAVGTNGVIMDGAGLRGYSATLGQVFNIPTNGDQPTFSNGVILVSNMYSTNIAGGTVVGAIITGGTIRTAGDGRRVEINSSGIQAINGALGKTYEDDSVKYGDNTRFYGSGVLVYINNNDYKVPFYVNQEQNVADLHLYNRSTWPTGKAELGDLAVIANKLAICTSAGTPGVWSSVGTETGLTVGSGSPSASVSTSPSKSPSNSPSFSPSGSTSPSNSPSISPSVSRSLSPSQSNSLSPSTSPSNSTSLSPSASESTSSSVSPSVSPSV